MDNVRMNDKDFFDLGEDSPSDNDTSSSDDDVNVILHGTPEQRRKLHNKLSSGCESDEFELEMENELDKRMNNIQQYQTSTSGIQSRKTDRKKQSRHNLHNQDFQLNSSEDECDLKLGPKLTNEELFYDPDMDDADQKWVDAQRAMHASSDPKKRAPNSDAVLDCPACLTTLCIDCQRHTIYSNQYRAMFVMNCTIDKSCVMTYPEQTRKRGKKSKPAKPIVKQARQSITKDNNIVAQTTMETSSEKTCELTQNTVVDVDNTQNQNFNKDNVVNMAENESSCVQNSKSNKSKFLNNDSSTKTNSVDGPSGNNGDTALTDQLSEDDFYGVNCSECNTRVAVIDRDELYHFYNVIPAYA